MDSLGIIYAPADGQIVIRYCDEWKVMTALTALNRHVNIENGEKKVAHFLFTL
jgi:hypothetical protein